MSDRDEAAKVGAAAIAANFHDDSQGSPEDWHDTALTALIAARDADLIVFTDELTKGVSGSGTPILYRRREVG